MTKDVSILAMAASSRTGSINQALIRQAAAHAEQLGAAVDLASFAEFDVPNYHCDINDVTGMPDGARHFVRRLEAADGWLLAVPEYNWSFPGNLKNLIDWASRAKPNPFRGRTCLLLSASPSVMGGVKGLLHLRQPLEALGMHVYPTVYTLAQSNQEMTEGGEIVSDVHRQRLHDCIDGWLDMTRRMRG